MTYEYHGPVRRYYITRNGVDLYLRYLPVNPRWVFSSFRQEIRPLVTTLVAGPHRARQLVATLAGAAHGLVRKRGPVPAGLLGVLSER
jgi:rhamnosyltransferase